MNIGENISNLRKAKNLTQEELAKIINVSPKTISSYETNRSIPNIEILTLLSQVLDTNINHILGLNNENAEEINKAYAKKNTKELIIKIIIMGIILIIPILFFWYAAYISIAAFTAHIHAFGTNDIVEASKNTLNLFTTFTKEYVIYLIILIINYILYRKKLRIPLLVINSIIFIIFTIDLIINGILLAVDLYIFLLAGLIGLSAGIKLILEKRHH